VSSAGVVESLARIVGEALSPLAERLQGDGAEELLEELGLRLPAGALGSGALPQALRDAGAACSQLPNAVAALDAAIGGDDDAAMVSAAAQLAQRIAQGADAFRRLGIAIDALVQASAGLTPAQKARLGAVAAAMPERLLHLAVISAVEDRQPALKGAFDLVGLFDDIHVDGDSTDASLPPHRLRRVRFDRLTSIFTDPVEQLEDLYGFGRPDFDGLELFRRIKQMVDRPDAEAILIVAPGQPPALEAFLFRIAVEPGAVPGLRLRLRANAERDVDVSVPLGGSWSASANSTARFQTGIEFRLHPQEGLRVEPPAAAASITLAFGLTAAHADDSPLILIGQAGGSRLELRRFVTRLPIEVSASAGASSPEIRVGAEAALEQGKLVIDTAQADGFIATILGGFRLESNFDVGALYDAEKGLRFTGSATIEIAIPAHIALGPLSIPTVYLIGRFDAGAIPVELSLDLGAQLGPIAVSVSRVGADARISFPATGGNAGVAQVDVAFKAPSGVGLLVDAALVKGGGYLYSDPARGEYAGALELELSGIVSLKAIGLLTTRMPDGSKGFSLIVVITAEFGTGIQLGFGFTLLAVGGLIGLNRTMRLQALAEGVRTGSVESVMFPEDVVANAPKIISDLRIFFPPEDGKTLIGPMAKLGWGTPTLVSISLGVIIEIPGNIAIVGVLKIALPAEDAPLVVLQVNFIGAIEFDKQRFWFFASMYESRVVFLTIEGQMGVLAAFGDDANFVLSVGGCHPQFNPPPLPFPSPRRISVNILNQPVARIRVEGYFAVTTNTAQFGARAELFFGFSACSIEGHLGFDALFQFSPFRFVIEMSFSVSLKVFGMGVFGIRVRLSLEGPSAWRAMGTGSISFFFFDIEVDFDITWGEGRDTSLPPIEVMPVLEAELRRDDNWRASLPAGNKLMVSLRQLEPGEAGMVLHPVGTLKVSQRAVPLDVPIGKVGNRKPSDGKRFSLAVTTGDLAKIADVDESFAPAQYDELGDGEKLSRPAYEPRHGGIELSVEGNQLASGAMVKRVVRYDLITIDTLYRRFKRRFFLYSAALFAHFLTGASVSLSVLSATHQKKLKPFEETIVVGPETFAVSFVDTNSTFAAETVGFSSVAVAQAYAAQLMADDPRLAGALHVIPEFEVAA
jgi:hypothetical protein